MHSCWRKTDSMHSCFTRSLHKLSHIIKSIYFYSKRGSDRYQIPLFYEQLFIYHIQFRFLQMQYPVTDLLGTSLVPELGSNVTAGTACHRHLVLITVSAVRALPD